MMKARADWFTVYFACVVTWAIASDSHLWSNYGEPIWGAALITFGWWLGDSAWDTAAAWWRRRRSAA